MNTADNADHMVVSFTTSNIHDLCLIEVQEDLGVAAPIRERAPVPFDAAIVSGHPRLAPTTITSGQFGDKRIITVAIGYRDCTQSEIANPDTAMMCLLVGKIVQTRVFEAIFVSALIQPGSSGSAVYDLWGNLGAVIFAGEGELGFGYAVPLEFVLTFLHKELATLTKEYPKDPSLADQEALNNTQVTKKLKDFCDNYLGQNKTIGQKRICNRVKMYEDLLKRVKYRL